MAIYDSIGKTYDSTRTADTRILDQLVALLHLPPGSRVLDVGCGSGNYTIPLFDRGFAVEGVDISPQMLSKARAKGPRVTWHQGDARALPFGDAQFDAVVSILATHHIEDLERSFGQMARVLKTGGRLVLFTSTPDQMRAFWLNHYMPTVVALTVAMMTDFEVLQTWLQELGFSTVHQQLFFVDNTLQDWFLQCGKYRPEVYLDPIVRAGISTFALCTDTAGLERGLALLEADIQSGAVAEVIERYERRDIGDFMFVYADKQRP